MSTEERVDQLEKHYNAIEKCDKWSGRLFWVCGLLSLAVPYSSIPSLGNFQQVFQIIFVLFVVSNSAVSNFSSYFLFPYAERQRRKQLLSNAFNVPLTTETTKGYYNNDLEPSIVRLGACVLENAFFAKNVLQEMAKHERIKVVVYTLVWLAAISYRTTNLGTILTITQILFSGEIIFRWIKIELLRTRNESVYDGLYAHFLNKVSHTKASGIASILDSFATYEAAKTAAAFKQSSKIFFRLNPKLIEEWDELKRQLNIDG